MLAGKVEKEMEKSSKDATAPSEGSREGSVEFDNYIINEKIDKYSTFDDIGLKDNILRGIYGYGFERPSPIQKLAIKPMIEGRDMITQSHSGTGKTGTFMIGVLSNIDESYKGTQAIVIAPTRELANQIFNVYKNLSRYTKVTGNLCIGGTLQNRYNYNKSNDEHVIIGTPGRISDLLGRGVIKNEGIKMIVIDEADDVLSSSFKRQNEKIFDCVSKTAQICLFSATIPDEMFGLTEKILNKPLKILVKEEELTLDGIKQYYVYIGNNDRYKFETLCDLYNRISVGQTMIYCNKRYVVEELSDKFRSLNFSVSQSHGEMRQKERQNVMKDFRSGKSRILISTDVLSRGIDVQQVSLVINYDVPRDTDTYLHRIGRSGRYGRKGVAINLITDRDTIKIRNIESVYKIKIEELPGNIEDIIKFI